MFAVLLNIIFTFVMLLHVRAVKTMRSEGHTPTWHDRAFSVVCGVVGIMSFSTSTLTMNTNMAEGITDVISGIVGMAVCIWTLTVFKHMKWENRA